MKIGPCAFLAKTKGEYLRYEKKLVKTKSNKGAYHSFLKSARIKFVIVAASFVSFITTL